MSKSFVLQKTLLFSKKKKKALTLFCIFVCAFVLCEVFQRFFWHEIVNKFFSENETVSIKKFVLIRENVIKKFVGPNKYIL